MMKRIALIALALAAACRETRTTPNVIPVVEQDSAIVALAVSDTAPPVGSVVLVTARLRTAGDSTAASYTARLQFDSTALRYVSDETISDGAMRASNPQPGLLRVAGAGVNGFTTGALFGARFEVLHLGALQSLHLTFDELHDSAVRDLRATIRVSQRIVSRVAR